MPMRLRLLLPLLALVAFASCSDRQEADHLEVARGRIHNAPCGSATAVAGVAGVNPDPHQVYLSDWVVVSVCHLDVLVRDAEARQQPVTLFIEGLDAGVEPSGMDLERGTLTFVLDRSEQNKGIWRQYLYDPLFDPYATMRVSVGIRGERPLPRADGANMTLKLKKLWVERSN